VKYDVLTAAWVGVLQRVGEMSGISQCRKSGYVVFKIWRRIV